MDWKDYQEEAAEFFRSIGLDAETDATIQGVRTKHDIDVLVNSHHAGFDVTWLVECKFWKTRISKLHILALREIVSDTGADRGIILAENGYQSGAFEAANLTNVHLTSLASVMTTLSNEIYAMRLRELYDRLIQSKEEYWDIPKGIRIEYGLRPEVGVSGFAGDWAVKVGEDLLAKGFRGVYPIVADEMHVMVSSSLLEQSIPAEINSVSELVDCIEGIVSTLEAKIYKCKKATTPET